MRTITINYKTLQYQVIRSDDRYRTDFYHGTKPVLRWVFDWGKLSLKRHEVEIPNLLFTIHANADNTDISKQQWRVKIENQLRLVTRHDELMKGELI